MRVRALAVHRSAPAATGEPSLPAERDAIPVVGALKTATNSPDNQLSWPWNPAPNPAPNHDGNPRPNISLPRRRYETQGRVISVRRIQAIVAERYAVSLPQLLGSTRPLALVVPRRVAMYLARQLAQLSTTEIGRLFRRDHTTVISAIRRVEEAAGGDAVFAGLVDQLAAEVIAGARPSPRTGPRNLTPLEEVTAELEHLGRNAASLSQQIREAVERLRRLEGR